MSGFRDLLSLLLAWWSAPTPIRVNFCNLQIVAPSLALTAAETGFGELQTATMGFTDLRLVQCEEIL